MNNIFKFLLMTSPIAALIFFYVFISQEKHDIETEVLDTKFEQSWNEFQSDFTKDPEKQKEFLRRAEEAAVKLAEQERQKEQVSKNFAEMKAEMEKEMKDFQLPEVK